MADSDTQPKLPKLFDGAPIQEHATKWAKCWEDKFTPWDRGGPSMALHDLLTENSDGIAAVQLPKKDDTEKRKTALVPGCGRGHDVLLLSSFGYDVYGLDVSAGALEAAKELAATASGPQHGKVHWICGDFFTDDWGQDVPTSFDLIFDYTFFCALPPSARPDWAARMRSLLLKSDGRLVCLEFPSEKSTAEPGPPWAAPSTEYLAHLTNHGGFRRLVHHKPRRTHESGTEDGRVQDFISVWAPIADGNV